MSVSINGTTGLVFNDGSTQPTAASGFGFKNRIINGAMVIDQRNAGASVTLTAANFVYPVDRWFAARNSGTSGAIAQRVSGSYVGGYAVRIQRNNGDTGTPQFAIGQVIESANCIGFAGNSITKTFRARCGANFSASGSQITARIGTGNGTDQSAANFYNNAWTGQANTNTAITLTTSWQTFTVTVAAGASVNQAGVLFYWTPSGTAGSNDWVEIEEVQLEKGSTATSFDVRPYAIEEELCQRYLPAWAGSGVYGMGIAANTDDSYIILSLPAPTRVAPTGIYASSGSGFVVSDITSSFSTTSAMSFSQASVYTLTIKAVASPQVSNRPVTIQGNSTSSLIYGTGCEL
jgi:hypothetical protein